MPIAFTPALPDTLRVAVPVDSPTRNSATAVLNFMATLDVADHDELQRDGGRIQLWSNIPFGGAGSPGDWASCDFEETMTSGSSVGDSDSTTEVFLGDARKGDVESSPGKRDLTLHLCVPTSNGESRFSFTYRIVYPSGEIRWLGEFGQNGTLVVAQMDADPVFMLPEGWVPGDGGYVWKGVGGDGQALSVVMGLTKPAEYAVWTVNGDSARKSPLAFFVPQLRPRSVYIPPTYVLCASSGAAVLVLSEGIIAASGTGSLLLKPLPSRKADLSALATNILAHCSPERVHIATLGEDAEHLVITSKGTHPTQGFIVPTTLHRHTRLVVPLHTLCALLPSRMTPFTLFSPQNHTVHFFTGSPTAVGFTSDVGGGPFVLSPVIDLKAGEWQVSILSPYTAAQASENDFGNLPTPPPSPQLRPIAHVSASGSVSDGSTRSSLSGSQLSLPDVVPTQNREAQEKVEDEEITDRRVVVRSRAPLLAQMRHLISLAFFILVTVYRLFFVTLESVDGQDREFIPDMDDAPMEGKRYDGDDETRATLLPPLQVTVSGQDPKLVSSVVAEIGSGVVVIASRSTYAAMGGPTGPIVVELNGQQVDVKETRFDGGVSLLEFDGGEGGVVRISDTT